jgi:hypothetical protein
VNFRKKDFTYLNYRDNLCFNKLTSPTINKTYQIKFTYPQFILRTNYRYKLSFINLKFNQKAFTRIHVCINKTAYNQNFNQICTLSPTIRITLMDPFNY